MSNNKTKVKKLALTLAAAQVFSVLPALPISNIAGLNNGSKVYAAEPQTKYVWGKYEKKANYRTKRVLADTSYFANTTTSYTKYETAALFPSGSKKWGDMTSGDIIDFGHKVFVVSGIHGTYNVDIILDGSWYKVEEKNELSYYSKGSKLDTVTSINPNAYPKNGEAGEFWYVYEGAVKTEADNFTPEINKITVSWGKPLNITGAVKNLPDGAKLEDITNPKINTKVSGDKTAKGKITFKDGSTKEVSIPVTVAKSESEGFTPKLKTISVKRNQPCDIKDAITNLPKGATVTVKTPVDTKTVGKTNGVLTVKFADGSTKDVNVPVTVTAASADEFNPKIEKVTVAWGKPLNITGAVKNLPDGAKLEDITNPKIDTKVSGDKTAKGKITFKDGSTKEVSIPVTVAKSESEGFTPKFKEITGVKGKPCDITKAITNLPAGASVKEVIPVDTKTVGTKTGKVKVTFADGSTKEVEVKATIVDSNAANIVDGKFIDTIKEEVVLAGGTIDLTDNIVADGKYTVKDITDPKIDTSKQGQYKGKVRITFDNGDVVEAEVPVIVLEDVEALKAKVKDLEAKLAAANAKNTELEKQVKDLNAKIKELEAQGKAKDAEIAALKKAKAELEAQAKLDKAEIAKLKGQIAGLEDAVKAKDNEIAGLKKQIKDLKDQVEKLTADNKKLQGDLDAANGKIKALEDENKGLKAKNQELTDKIAGLEKQVADKDKEIKALNDKIGGLNQLIKELQDKINGLNGDLDKANQKIADAKKELEDLQKELQAKIDELNNKIADKEQQGKDLQKQLDEEKAKSDADQGKIKDLEDQIKKNADDEKALQDQKKGLEDQVAEKEAQIADLEKQAKELQDKIAGLEDKIKDLINDKALSQGEIDKLVADKANLQKELADAKAKIQELEGKNSDLEKQLADAQARIKELEGQIGKLNDLIKQLQAKIDGLNKDLEGANQKVADAKKELADLQKELKAKIDELNNKIADKDAKGKDLEKQLEDEKSKGTVDQAKIDELNKAIEENNKAKSDLEGQKKDLEDKLAEKEAQIAKLEEEAKGLKDNITTLENEIKDLLNDKALSKEEVDKLKQDLADAQAKVKELEGKVSNQNQLIKELQEKLAAMEKELAKANEDLDNSKKELQKAKDELQAKIDELNNKIADKEQEGKDLQKQLEDEKAKGNADSDKIKDLEDKIKKNADEEKGLQDQRKSLEDQLAEKEAKIKALEDKAAGLEKDVKDLKDRIQDLIDGNIASEGDAAKVKKELEDKIAALEKQLNAKIGEVAKLTDQINALNKKIKDKDAKIKALEEEAAKFDKNNKKLETENNKLKEDNKKQGTEIKSKEDKIKDLENDIIFLKRNGFNDYNYDKSLKEERDNARKELDAKTKELDKLKKEMTNKVDREFANRDLVIKWVFKIGSSEVTKVYKNKSTHFTMDVVPYIKNDKTMLPLRYVAYTLGCEVTWDNATRTARFTKDGVTASIQIDGNKIVMSDGRVVNLTAKPDNKNGRIFVPLTDVSKVLGVTNGNTSDGINQTIEWDNATRTVSVLENL